MGQISRPMQILLAVVVVFAMAWFVVLRPKGGGDSASTTPPPAGAKAADATAPGVKGLTSAIDKAKGAVATSKENAKALGAASDRASGDAAGASASAAPGTAAKGAKTGAAGAAGDAPVHVRGHGPVARAANALAAHKVLAILFYNPRGSDDRAVRQEFKHIGGHHGKVVTIAAPLAKVATFRAVTKQVAVTGSPTVVLFDRLGAPQSIVGFADRAELNARVDAALAGIVTAGAPTP
jgi:hypothetical protein